MAHLATLFKPKMIIAGGSAYPRDWDYKRMRNIADSVDAYLLADMAHIAGLVATKQCNNPFDFCDVVTSTTHKTLRGPRSGLIFCKRELLDIINNAVFPALQGGPHNHQIAAVATALKEASTIDFKEYILQVKKNAIHLANELAKRGYIIATNGTENHIVLWDARPLGISGSKLEKIFERCAISVNKNSLYGDVSAVTPGGVRLGTPAMTTRGFKEEDFSYVVELIDNVVSIALELNRDPERKKLSDFVAGFERQDIALRLASIKSKVEEFASKFPMPGINPRS